MKISDRYSSIICALGVILPVMGCGPLAWAGEMTKDVAAASYGAVPDTSAQPNIPFDYNQYAGWIPPSTDPASQLTASLKTVTAGDVYDGLATGTLVQQQTISTYQKTLNDQVNVRYEDQVITSPQLTQATSATESQAHQQKLSLQVAPANQLNVSGNVHTSTNPDPLGNNTTSTGVGMDATSSLPLHAQLTLSANADKVTGDSLLVPAAQANTLQAQVQQPLGKLPVTAIMATSQTTTTSAGTTSQSPGLEQALELKLRPEDTFRIGVREMQYVQMNDVNYSNSVYADFSHQVTPQMTWHSYADMLQMQGVDDIASTNNNPNINPVDNKSFTFATGPAISLEKDLTARVEFSNTWDNSNNGPSTEHRISLSVNGTF